ncbi:MAG: tRNA (adenine(22)-N(1))-methyltransferase [Cellulosilyticaceae bacterium]
MQLSTRLYTMAKFVQKESRVVDVGTDHGYIPIYLSENNIVKSCIASDINKGPLENAAKHMVKYNINNIELRQGNGLQKITLEDAIDTIIIGGMGGYLIIDILKNAEAIVKGVGHLILQPQNNIGEVRKYVHEMGFKIKEEEFITEEGKYYTVIYAIPGNETYSHEYEYVYGKITLEKQNEVFKAWMSHKEKTFKQIYETLASNPSESSLARKKELDEEYRIYEEAKKCIR